MYYQHFILKQRRKNNHFSKCMCHLNIYYMVYFPLKCYSFLNLINPSSHGTNTELTKFFPAVSVT